MASFPTRYGDWWVLRKVARSDLGAADRVLPALTKAADGGRLWIGAAVVLACSGRRGRLAAVKGLLAIGMTSGLVNGPLKRIARRRRPSGLLAIGLGRRSGRVPQTSSFPSGHTASAAAFAVAAGSEQPLLLGALVPLAVGVGWSRIKGGRHFPTDVVAGATIGAATGLGARWLVKRVGRRLQEDNAPAAPEPA